MNDRGPPTSLMRTVIEGIALLSLLSGHNSPTNPTNRAENREQRCRERVKLVIEGLTLLAVIFYGGVSYYQWQAMRLSNQQTKAALHVAERAYITTDTPTLDPATKFINFFVTNSGRIPSGPVETVVHEATVNSSIPNVPPNAAQATEYHWKRHRVASLPPGKDLIGFAVPVRAFDSTKFTDQGAYQSLVVAGQVTYSDGFPDDSQQQWLFCFQSVYHLTLKRIFLVPCDPERVIPQMEKRDGFPQNEAN